jgi:2-iminobutanoate/2-iminopropanoate deaminase
VLIIKLVPRTIAHPFRKHEKKNMSQKSWKVIFWLIISLGIALAPWVVLAQHPPIQKTKFNLNKADEDAIGYAQAVKVGKTLYISGSVGEGDMDKAVKLVYQELEKTLRAYGASFQNVVKENVFTTDLEGFKLKQELRKEFYKGDFPAATWVEVRQLYAPQLILEVELIAELE